MKCLICGRTGWVTKFEYTEPDKYEQHQKIKDVRRSWLQCTRCGHYQQIRNYTLKRLERIYQGGYRSERFRGESISKAFKRLRNLPFGQSENRQRIEWYSRVCSVKNILDVGSGIGVWPMLLKGYGADICCVEENKYSIDFISNILKIPCFANIPKHRMFETVTLLHVLEHIEKPTEFLAKLIPVIEASGELFIEVPDDSEFGYLKKDHDEFNSCHVHFYSMASLYKVLDRSGFSVTDMHREYYPKRRLTRLMARAIVKA